MGRLDGDTAVVTGAAVGIGSEIAKTLASAGAKVVVSDIQSGEETVRAIEESGGQAEFREGDVTDEDSMEGVFEGLEVDVLVNNAAYFSPLIGNRKRFDEITSEEWDTVTSVTSKGVFTATKAAFDQLEDGARIVNISSGSALRGSSGMLHYVAAKTAVIGITRSMSNELGEFGIRVNAITPGPTATEYTKEQSGDKLKQVLQTQDIEIQIVPHDIAETVLFLVDEDRSRMITGQVINVDGGRSYY